MLRFLFFSFLLFCSFLFEQSVLLPLGLSPGGFLISFFVFIIGLFFLADDARWWFVLCGGAVAGVFSAMPLFLFLLFVCAGALFLFIKPFLPIERAFSFLTALWFGVALYFLASFVLLGSAWIFGFFDTVVFRSFFSFFVSVALFSLGALIPVGVVWWLFLYGRRNRQSYMLQ